MSVRIIVGDAREELSNLADASVDLVLTDPPYGETSLAWDRWPSGWPARVRRVLKPTGSMWVFGSARMFLENADEFDGWRFAQDVVWEKHNGSGFHADRFKRVHESAYQFYRDDAPWAPIYKQPQFIPYFGPDKHARARKARTPHTGDIGPHDYKDDGTRMMRSIIFARSENGRAEHPTQKPIGIVEPLLLYSCPPGGVVLDPFAGSGTTAVAAQRHGRDAILIELNPEYAAMARRRIDGDAPLFARAAE